MSTAVCRAERIVADPILPADICRAVMEDDSPFGLQGLKREAIKILKAENVGHLAAALALYGTPEQIRDASFVARILARFEQWQDEYQVIHLIERSLWIDGRSDLVMSLLRNPSRIPDNPPDSILNVMSDAIAAHPEATVWFGVPLFGEQTNDEGLPIPLTADQVRAEAERRIAAAQQHALRWRWAYRVAFRACGLPRAMWRLGASCCRAALRGAENCRKYWKRVRRDLRNRNRARIIAQSEYHRMGRSWTVPPQHTTLLGKLSEGTFESIRFANGLIAHHASSLEALAPYATGAVPIAIQGIGVAGLSLGGIAPLLITPMTIVACDPFLFIELPDEPGKFRFLGHWYWQGPPKGKQKLHLHV